MDIYLIGLVIATISIFIILKLFVFNVLSFKNKITKSNPDYVEPDLTERISKQKIQKKIDYIIIGSGTSGLMTSALLSKLGKKVLMLESHDRLGGCFHTFTEKGYEFDTGFHYVGNLSVFKILVKLVSSKDVEWNVFNHFDNVRIGDKDYKLEAPIGKFFSNLKADFPKDTEAIDKYLAYSRQSFVLTRCIIGSSILPQFLRKLFHIFLAIRYSNIYNKSANQVFQDTGIAKNPRLQTVLTGISGDIGCNQDQMPFSAHVGLVSHFYTNGSMYPKNGTKDIIKSIVSTINSNGGKCFTKARVEKILVKNGNVEGVEIRGGGKILCKKVISTMGTPNTIEALPDQYKFKNPDGYDDTWNNYSIFLGLNTEGMKEKVPEHNTWYFPLKNGETCKTSDEFSAENLKYNRQDTRILFFSFASAKQRITHNKHSLCILGETCWKEVEKYRINDVRREQGYKDHKQRVLDEVIDEFLKIYPQFKDRIEYKDIGTPLTNETYYNRKTPYGVQFTTEKYFDHKRMFNPYTNVKGLYLSGQDLCFAGFLGSLISGVITTMKAEGYAY